MMVWLLVAQCLATWYMVGLIWMVQLVHYPLMARVGADRFVEYERLHVGLMGLVVVPAMVTELVTAACCAVMFGSRFGGLYWWGLGLVVLIWASTFLIQVPLHDQLSAAFDSDAHRRLVLSNWIRTLAWTARGGIVAWGLSRLVSTAA